jgi:2-polyprenyl-3-methyl-5-hydroxy-6-metoxy-1,4-benzoquinol methylase
MNFLPADRTASLPLAGSLVEWEEVDCLLCGSARWKTFVEAPDQTRGGSGLWFAVVKCEECGLCFTNPRPHPQTLPRFYPPDYGPHQRRPLPTASRSCWRRRLWRRTPPDQPTLPWHGSGRLLDFGCGSGAFLRRMLLEGWQVVGLDFSAEAVSRIRTQPGLTALTGTLPHPKLLPASFDCITMRQALEHVPDPLDLLRAAYDLLVPGGQLVVGVPNLDSLPFHWFGPDWFGLDLPRHLTHFTPTTLLRMLERAGFHVGTVTHQGHGKWLRASAQLACADRRAPRWYRWLKHGPTSRLAAWACALLKQADSLWVTARK